MNRHVLGGLALLAATQAMAGELFVLNYGAPAVLGQQGNRDASAGRFAVSDDGRYAVFVTASDNLSDDAGDRPDVFLKDTLTGDTTRVSRAGDGGEPDGSSRQAAISGDGRWIAYVSEASDLVTPPAQGTNLYLFDRSSGITQRVAPSPLPTPATWAANLNDPVLSFDGSRVAFTTDAVLVAGDTDLYDDAYLWSRDSGTFTLLSVDGAGQALPGVVYAGSVALSADGLRASFVMRVMPAGTSGGIFVRDLAQAATDRVANAPVGPTYVRTSLSADGRYVAFDTSEAVLPADANGVPDVYVFDRTTRSAEFVSVGTGGAAGNGPSVDAALSGDGRYVVFGSAATNLDGAAPGRQIYRRDRVAATTMRLTPATGEPWYDAPAISADGTRVVLSSHENLVADDTNRRADVYAIDANGARRLSITDKAARLSGATTPARQIRDAGGAFVLGDGSVAYASGADNLGPSRRPALFRFDRSSGQTMDFPLDALTSFPAWPVYLMLVGASDNGSRYLVRREPLHINTGWGTPPPDTPRDLWRVSASGVVRLDEPAVVGANTRTLQAMLSDDGRYAVFVSEGPPDGVSPSVTRLFLHDADTGLLTRIDVNAQNQPVDAPIQRRTGLSRNGRYTALVTAANNLVANDADGSMDLFLRDNLSGELQRLRDPQTGAPLAHPLLQDTTPIVVSDDGQRIAFTDPVDMTSDRTVLNRLRFLDRTAGRVFTIFRDDPLTVFRDLTMSADGGVLAFVSAGPLMLPGEIADIDNDVYTYRLADNWLRLESVDGDGANGAGQRQAPRLSADGRSLTFQAIGAGWRTTPQVSGDSDWLFKRLDGDPIFADGFDAAAR